jgi:putative spermidine/putrescine transport system substrate-binding protein
MRRLQFPATLVAFGLLAAACTSGPGASTGPSALKTLPAAEKELDLVIWVGYAEKGETYPEFDWVTKFQNDTGCIVKTKDGIDSANMVNLMASGQYDGVSASGDATLRMIAAGTVAPVNTDLVPNYANVFAGLKGQPHNTVNGVPYGVPHGRGANLLIYNTDTFPVAPTTWDPVWDATGPAAGKVSIYNGNIYIADAALRLMKTKPDLGITDPYQLSQAQFDAAIALLKEQKKIVADYWTSADEQITSFASGAMLAGTGWQYQGNNMPADAHVALVKPAEGTTGWSDTWMISSTAAHPGCMYRWMNWIISPEANAQATIYFGEAPVSPQACAYAETWQDGAYKGHCDRTHATDESYFADLWFWSTARKDCGDTDAATTCVTAEDWIQGWTEITGG